MQQLRVSDATKKVIEMSLIHESMGLKDEIAEKDYGDETTLKKVAELRGLEKAIKETFKNWEKVS